MGLRCGMRTTKCQLLVTSLCVMVSGQVWGDLCRTKLLGLSIATLSTVTHYGLRFTLISNVSLDSNAYRVIHHTAFYFGICLSMTLILAALLSSAATVRESQCLTAMGFFCFALAFCGLIPAACWRYTHSTEVEDSMMDVYDFVYEEVRRNTSSFRRHELTAIHQAVSHRSPAGENLALGFVSEEYWRLRGLFYRAGDSYRSKTTAQDAVGIGDFSVAQQFLCCGKHSPFGDTTSVEKKTCPPSQVHNEEQDCLQEIQDFLKKHKDFVFLLLGIAIGFTVYGMILTSFLWFSIHFSSNLYRKGKYILREK